MRAKLGIGRTYQKSRLFLGMSVEDNLYVAILGVRRGHLRPVVLPGRDGALRERARELAGTVGLDGREASSSARSRTVSNASSKSRWRARSIRG